MESGKKGARGERESSERRPHISVVTPVYGCAATLPKLYERLKKTLERISSDFEILMVDDASPDGAWKRIEKLAEVDSRVKGIRLSRNFGQHRAITAGLDYATGEWVVVMDCDLQDQPEEIVKFYRKAQEGFDVVVGQRKERKDHWLKRLSSSAFYKIYNYLAGTNVNKEISNFGIYSQKVIKSIQQMREQNRSFGLFVLWSGFRRVEIPIDHAGRESGNSSYTLKKLVELAIDSIVAHSNKPLRLSIEFGFMISLLSLLYACYLIFRYIFFGVPVAGWTSVMVSIYFIGGLLFANMGLLGLYIGKIFDEVKERPLYIVSETTFGTKDIDATTS